MSGTCHDYSSITLLLDLKSLDERRFVADTCLLGNISNGHTNGSRISASIDFNVSLAERRQELRNLE